MVGFLLFLYNKGVERHGEIEVYKPKNHVHFVTASSLFDGHEATSEAAIEQLKQVAKTNGNLFEQLMETVKVASLGQITNALYEVGGQYRRNM